MAASYLPDAAKAVWESTEPQSKNIRIRQDSIKNFPEQGNEDFERWLKTVCISLDENGLKHHLEMDDDILCAGLSAEDKDRKTHKDLSEFPCDTGDGSEGAVNKYSTKLKAARHQNRIKIFAFLSGKCTDDTDAQYIAEEKDVYGKPRTLLLRLKEHYVRIDTNEVERLEKQFELFTMAHAEPFDAIKLRIDQITRELD
jgi:hypothetical protein